MRNRISNLGPGRNRGWSSLAVVLTLGLVLLALLTSGPRTWATVGQDSLYSTVPTRTPTPGPTDTPLPSPTHTPTREHTGGDEATPTPTRTPGGTGGDGATPTPTATPPQAPAAGATPPDVLPVTGGRCPAP